MEKKKNAAEFSRKMERVEIPIESQTDLLRVWIQLAGESKGRECAEAWATVRRIAHAMEIRAARNFRAAVAEA